MTAIYQKDSTFTALSLLLLSNFSFQAPSSLLMRVAPRNSICNERSKKRICQKRNLAQFFVSFRYWMVYGFLMTFWLFLLKFFNRLWNFFITKQDAVKWKSWPSWHQAWVVSYLVFLFSQLFLRTKASKPTFLVKNFELKASTWKLFLFRTEIS